MNTTTRRQRLALLLGLIATGLETVDAAEWTRQIDITATAQRNAAADEVILTGPHGFSVGTSFAITPDGQRVGTFSIPEQFGLNGKDYYSSRRGKLWTYTAYHAERSDIDGAGNIWVNLYQGFFDWWTSVVRLAPDGAAPQIVFQETDGNAAPAFAALRDTAGALVGDCAYANAVSSGKVLRVDGTGGTTAELPSPGCPTRIVDDRAGGAYVGFRVTSSGPVSMIRTTANGIAWKTPLANAEPLAAIDGTTIVTAEGTDVSLRSADGLLLQRVQNADRTTVRTHDHGFWVATSDHRSLIHVDRSGETRHVNHDEQVLGLHVLDNGLVLVQDPVGLTLYSLQGQRLADRDTLAIQRAASLVHNANGYVAVQEGYGRQLRVFDGTSFNLPLTMNAGMDLLVDVAGNGNRICLAQITTLNPTSSSLLDCYARDDGRLLQSSVHNEVSGIANPRILSLTDSGTVVLYNNVVVAYDAAGVLRFELPRTSAVAYDPRFGLALGGFEQVALHGTDGSLRAQGVLPSDFEPKRLVWMEDGGLVVIGNRQDRTHLYRIDTSGTVLGETTLALYHRIDDVIDTGTTILATVHAEFRPGPAQLLRLDRTTLATRATEPTPGPDTRFWRGENGHFWLSGRSDGRISLLHLDHGGQVLGRRVLPLAKGDLVYVRSNGELAAVQKTHIIGGAVTLLTHSPTATESRIPLAQSALGGAWYSPESTGQGLLIHPLNDAKQWFAAWHTFDSSGENELAKQQWLTVQGDVHEERGAIQLPIYRNSQGGFDLAGRTGAVAVGSAELVFTSCDRMEFWWRIGDDSGALPLQRLTPRTQPCNNGTQVEPAADAAPAIDLTGPWYDPSRSGQGLAVSTSGARFKQFFAGWFTYDVDGHRDDADAQHWFTVQGSTPARYGETVTASVFRTTGGSRAGAPTRNTHKVGSALLTVHDCAHATLEYVFDDSAVAAAFANRQRVVPLTRLGRCDD